MTNLALAGLNVLDLSDSIGGAYCTKLLGDLGATVVMVEPPSGHPLRRQGPFVDGEPDPDRSGLFIHFCTNKRSVSLDLDQKVSRARVLDLAEDADIVVESFRPGRLAALGLGYEALKNRNPSLVLVSLTSFGQTGPYSRWQSEEIVEHALGGYMYFGGNPQREPLMVNNHQAALQGGAQAAIAALVARWEARRSGAGQWVDVSTVEAMLTAHIWTTAHWTHEGIVMRREGADTLRCKDGWVHFMRPMRADPAVFAMLERPDLVDDPRFTDQTHWIEHQDFIGELLRDWCSSRLKEDIFRTGQELRIPCAPVYTTEEQLKHPQIRSREWLVKVEHPVAGEVAVPGFPYQWSESPPSLRHPAPRLGEHAEGWPEEARSRQPEAPITAGRSSLRPSGGDRLPLEGLRILELTSNWAGPVAARFLADMGAESIKIEAADRIFGRALHYAGQQAFKYFYNRGGYFNKLNRNKYGTGLDVSTEEGRELFLRMVKDADVVLENNSPRVMRNHRIDYEHLREANPDIIMVSISAFGQTGPLRDYVAYGANIEASCGLAAVTGYRDEEQPYRSSYFYADPVTACHATVAILAALSYRQRTGKGQYIDLSLQENGMCFFPEAFMEYTVTGETAKRRGNRHWGAALQGCYPSLGDDMWMVLCIRDDDDWRRFQDAVGDERLGDPRFGGAEGRLAAHDELDGMIADWTRQYDHHEASAILQRARVPAAPVLANWEMVSNLHFNERGFYITYPHQEMGVFPYPGFPWKFSRTPGSVRKAAPLLGEHNRLVLRDYLGLSEERYEELCRRRIIADAPPPELMTLG